MFRLGTRKWVSLIESHATRYRTNHTTLSVPNTLLAGAGGRGGLPCLWAGGLYFSHCRALAEEGSS